MLPKHFLLLVGFIFFSWNLSAVHPIEEISENPAVFTEKPKRGSTSILKNKSKKKKRIKKSQKKKRKINFTFGRLSLGLGILGALLIWQPYISILGLLCSLAAVVLGILGLKKEEHKKMSKWGIALGGLGIMYFLTIFVLVLLL